MKEAIKPIAVAVTLLLVLALGYFSIEILGDYGFVVFVLIPFAIGYLPPAIVSRKQILSRNEAFALSFLTLGLSCLLMLVFALEGMICIVMALPILLLLTWLGSYIAFKTQNTSLQKSSVSFIFLGLISIALLSFDSIDLPSEPIPVRTTVIVNAQIEEVWTHVVTFDSIAEPSDWIFKTGISYPTNATIEGVDIGAVRYCNFSTGSFVEPITTWNEPTLLQFDVASQPIPMNELNPFGDVHPPHLEGYFKYHRGQFKLTEKEDGTTELEGTTWYTVDISPKYYWGSWAEFVVHRIHERVLNHIKIETEMKNSSQHPI